MRLKLLAVGKKAEEKNNCAQYILQIFIKVGRKKGGRGAMCAIHLADIHKNTSENTGEKYISKESAKYILQIFIKV